MKTRIIIVIALFTNVQVGFSQDNFQDLKFEAANVSGDEVNSLVPTTSAFPGWQAFIGTSATSQVGYDFISIGAPLISIVDNKVAPPIQGNYTAYLFAATFSTVSYSATLSQTATVPSGTESIQMDASQSDYASFVVTLGGTTINMIPLQTFSDYTLYGGDVSTFAGNDVTLSITELPPTISGYSPSLLELDNITFSTTVVPEPNVVALSAMGGLLFVARKWFARRC
jgi:hypothetical protein